MSVHSYAVLRTDYVMPDGYLPQRVQSLGNFTQGGIFWGALPNKPTVNLSPLLDEESERQRKAAYDLRAQNAVNPTRKMAPPTIGFGPYVYAADSDAIAEARKLRFFYHRAFYKSNVTGCFQKSYGLLALNNFTVDLAIAPRVDWDETKGFLQPRYEDVGSKVSGPYSPTDVDWPRTRISLEAGDLLVMYGEVAIAMGVEDRVVMARVIPLSSDNANRAESHQAIVTTHVAPKNPNHMSWKFSNSFDRSNTMKVADVLELAKETTVSPLYYEQGQPFHELVNPVCDDDLAELQGRANYEMLAATGHVEKLLPENKLVSVTDLDRFFGPKEPADVELARQVITVESEDPLVVRVKQAIEAYVNKYDAGTYQDTDAPNLKKLLEHARARNMLSSSAPKRRRKSAQSPRKRKKEDTKFKDRYHDYMNTMSAQDPSRVQLAKRWRDYVHDPENASKRRLVEELMQESFKLQYCDDAELWGMEDGGAFTSVGDARAEALKIDHSGFPQLWKLMKLGPDGSYQQVEWENN